MDHEIAMRREAQALAEKAMASCGNCRGRRARELCSNPGRCVLRVLPKRHPKRALLFGQAKIELALIRG